MKKKGTKQEVFNGIAEKTNGGLKKEDLILNKRGSIVSKKRSQQGLLQFKNIEPFIKAKHPKNLQEAQETEKVEEAKGGGIELKPEAVQEEKASIPEAAPEKCSVPEAPIQQAPSEEDQKKEIEIKKQSIRGRGRGRGRGTI
jgi:hypothetical protein